MERRLTVAALRGSEAKDHVEVLFLESARIYLLERARPDFDELIDLLRAGRQVRITVAPPDGDLIQAVAACPPSGDDTKG